MLVHISIKSKNLKLNAFYNSLNKNKLIILNLVILHQYKILSEIDRTSTFLNTNISVVMALDYRT